HTAVKPPAAAAAAPLAIVSACSKPGSRRWTWRSMRPGATTLPAAEITVVPCSTGMLRPTASILPSRMSRSAGPAPVPAGAIIRPPRTSRSLIGGSRFPDSGIRTLPIRPSPSQQIEHRHPHRHAVGYLRQDHAVRSVGDVAVDLDAAVHRPRMQDHQLAGRTL